MKTHALLAKGMALGLIVAALPLAAQEPASERKMTTRAADTSEKDVAAMMQAMFKLEPLNPDQQSRLPQAEKLIARIMPPGTMAQVMGGMYDKMLAPMMAMAGEPSSSEIAGELGVDPDDLDLEADEVARIAAILDPAWKERRKAETAAMQRAMTTAMTALEPGMRKGMAEAYAINFTSAELTDIDRFFSTPSGASFARKSYALASDPRLIAASIEGLPQLMAQMKAMEQDMKAAAAPFPPRRGYADLSAAQRDELARLTGLQQDAIREGMERVAAERAAKDQPEQEG